MNPFLNHSRDKSSFVLKLRIGQIFLKILKVRGSFLNNKKGIWLDLLKHYLISMDPSIPQDDSKFFHRTIENLTINFIVFIHRFNP